MLTYPNVNSNGNQAPNAYLNILFFDERFKFDEAASRVIPIGYNPGSKGTIAKLASNAVAAGKNGYVYVYFSNESEELVFFDNFKLSHERGRILEETHYYAFGLTIAGISSKSTNGILENRFKFNDGTELANKEFSDGSGLDWYETTYRNYDPQIGKFWQIDPMADFSFEISPYSFGLNNPLIFIDPLGLDSDSTKNTGISSSENPQELEAVTVTAKIKKLEGGYYDGKYYSSIQVQSFFAFGYSKSISRKLISHDDMKHAFEIWIKELQSLSKLYEYGAILSGGSILDLKSLKDYKEIFKRLLKERKIQGGNPALIAVATIMGIRANQLMDHAEELSEILIKYGFIHSSNGTKGRGIYVITEKTYVGTMGPSGGSEIMHFYDVTSKQIISNTNERY